jgi:hypothetical protein
MPLKPEKCKAKNQSCAILDLTRCIIVIVAVWIPAFAGMTEMKIVNQVQYRGF